MSTLGKLLLNETQVSFQRERKYTIDIINQVYKDWKKINRRKNAINMVTTSINKLNTINPSMVNHVHDAARIKLCVILMRCMDIPPFMELSSKESHYKKLFPLIDVLQFNEPNTDTNGTLGEIIMTRLSACNFYDNDEAKAFVSYEPNITKKYLHYIFGDKLPEKTYKMQVLKMPEDFESLVHIININQDKANTKFLEQDLD